MSELITEVNYIIYMPVGGALRTLIYGLILLLGLFPILEFWDPVSVHRLPCCKLSLALSSLASGTGKLWTLI